VKNASLSAITRDTHAEITSAGASADAPFFGTHSSPHSNGRTTRSVVTDAR